MANNEKQPDFAAIAALETMRYKGRPVGSRTALMAAGHTILNAGEDGMVAKDVSRKIGLHEASLIRVVQGFKEMSLIEVGEPIELPGVVSRRPRPYVPTEALESVLTDYNSLHRNFLSREAHYTRATIDRLARKTFAAGRDLEPVSYEQLGRDTGLHQLTVASISLEAFAVTAGLREAMFAEPIE